MSVIILYCIVPLSNINIQFLEMFGNFEKKISEYRQSGALKCERRRCRVYWTGGIDYRADVDNAVYDIIIPRMICRLMVFWVLFLLVIVKKEQLPQDDL